MRGKGEEAMMVGLWLVAVCVVMAVVVFVVVGR